MSSGPMPMRIRLGLVLALMVGPALAEPASCDRLRQEMKGLAGLTAPPSGVEDGWCVLDGARTGGEGLRITVERLRVRGEVVQDRLTRLSLVAKGLRARPALDDRDMPDWLRDALRLQSAEVHLILARDEDADRLRLEFGQVKLSGGAEAVVLAEVAGAEIAPDALLKLGEGLGTLGQVPEACVTLGEVGTRFPGSMAATQATVAMQGFGCQ